eukprot:CAMPEP_0174280274 /NCGR_PEP_ID=MMETSP0809-20121228/544_1 /TAXON_ID=73025 ORGANISM="Eutreptiella gymnastica-like, Strain CCMP1594" /NCGR_SAMPLE_ID=MMETSP0809 /ASSEMBLY_ACC=CAM_ASM_000658 /LENGTH=89 /DNA_ID=CAMNT_0015373051 /DNA_START=807 /DNA_END=1077 /DNA_ORIENTATION=-
MPPVSWQSSKAHIGAEAHGPQSAREPNAVNQALPHHALHAATRSTTRERIEVASSMIKPSHVYWGEQANGTTSPFATLCTPMFPRALNV